VQPNRSCSATRPLRLDVTSTLMAGVCDSVSGSTHATASGTPQLSASATSTINSTKPAREPHAISARSLPLPPPAPRGPLRVYGEAPRRRPKKPRSDAPGPQDGVRRPWWRRMFGG
jgi:hypothetical protein